MANGKTYEMLYKLNAQLDGRYNSAFQSAQSALTSMQREIQALSQTQSDISAFQKQQNAVEATKNKLEVLQQQYDNIQKEIEETEGYSSALENRLLSKQQQIDKTSAALEQQTQKLGQMDVALQEADIDTGNLAQESARLESQMDELCQQQDQVVESSQEFGDTSVQAFSAIQEAIAAAGIAAALKEIYEGYMACVTISGDFEAVMSSVEALSGANAAEMEQLSDKAKELGATTEFTAQQSGEAMEYMAMAGWDVNDMLSGMDGVMKLTSASGEDLAMVSDIVTDSLSAFGLTAEDTAHFSDVLASAATSANTNVSIMGETFKMSASVAGALGYSIEDVAVAVGLMANSGVKGSIAGTALKNTFNGLLEGATLTANAFGEYEYSAVKADGTMKSFGSTIDELRGYFDQMTEAERVNNAITIAGQYGYNGLLAILNATDEDYASLTESINNCSGAASRMAAIKLDNMNGELTLAKSAWDALKMSVGDQFTPVMRKLYAVAADVFGVLGNLVEQNPQLIKAAVAFAAIIGTVVAALTAYAAIAKAVAAANALLEASIPGVNVILAATAAVAGITAGIVALASASDDAVPSVQELTEAASSMTDTMEDASATYEDVATSTLATASVADTYISKLEQLEAAGITSDDQAKQYHNTLALLCQVVPDLADCIDLETDTIDGGTAALRANTEAWKKNAMQQAYQDQLNSQNEKYAAVLIEAEKNSIGLTKAQYDLEAAHQKQNDTIDRMNQLYAEAQQKAEEYKNQTGEITDATGFLSQEYYDLQDSLPGIADEIYAAEQSIDNYNEAIEEDSEATAEAKEQMALAEEAVRNLTGATEEGTESAAEAAQQEEGIQSVIEGVTEKISALTEAYNEAYGAALGSISGQYNLWDEAADVVAINADTINSALESQISYWQDYNSNLQSLTERSADIAGLSEVIASFADGSEESVNAIAGMASASDEDLAGMVANWQTLQKEQQNAAGSVADLKTDFTTTMDELQKELVEDIEAMDLGPEAAESGKATIQGYIDGANGLLPQVKAAYASIAQAAANALNSVTPTVTGGYATGTMSAKQGWAWVGENGPELMYMHGGETIFPADMSQEIASADELSGDNMQMIALAPQLMSALSTLDSRNAISAETFDNAGDNIVLTVAPVYTISGTPNTAEIEAILRRHDAELREYILDVIEEADIDAKRRAYS